MGIVAHVSKTEVFLRDPPSFIDRAASCTDDGRSRDADGEGRLDDAALRTRSRVLGAILDAPVALATIEATNDTDNSHKINSIT